MKCLALALFLCLTLLLCPATQANQGDISQNLALEFTQGNYTLDQPLVVVNPYGNAPLSALICFQTQGQGPGNITAKVLGTSTETTFAQHFTGTSTWHSLPIYGLYPDRENQVELVFHPEDGGAQQVVIPVTTQPLPQEMAELIPEFSQEYLQFHSSGLPLATDSLGEIRWCFAPEEGVEAWQMLESGLVVASVQNILTLFTPLGQEVGRFALAGQPTQIQELVGGDLLITTTGVEFAPPQSENPDQPVPPGFSPADTLWIRLDRNTGAVLWVWNDLPEPAEVPSTSGKTRQEFQFSTPVTSLDLRQFTLPVTLGHRPEVWGQAGPVVWETPVIPPPVTPGVLHGGDTIRQTGPSFPWGGLVFALAGVSFLLAKGKNHS